MSESDEDLGDKPHDPTPRKLEEARKRGQVPRSQDLNTAAAYGGFALAFLAFGSASVETIGLLGKVAFDQADRLAPAMLSHGSALSAGMILQVAGGALPWLAIPAALALLSVLAQRSLLMTPESLAPKLSRISPLATAAHKFGRLGLFEFAKSAVKLVVVSAVLVLFLMAEIDSVLGMAALPPGMAFAELARISFSFLLVVLCISLAIAVPDYLWQRLQHIRQNRMSHKELMDETKESEGDPHLKSERRRRGIDIATNRMLADVPKADVVIVNPTHYAVALKWTRARGSAPVCLAKGVDEVAARIREAAAKSGVPLHRDPPTARAIHASVKIGQEIRPEHYRAVAAAIRFAERMRTKARGRLSG